MKYPKLKGKRAELGLTQNEMAFKLGISTSAYNLKECGQREFKTDEIAKILNIFNSKFEDIFISELSHK